MGRVRVYSSNAERQAAYRARLAERRSRDGTGRLTARLRQLETALADAIRRADVAEIRAARAESDARRDLEDDLAVALGRVADLEATVAELRRRLAQDTTTAASPSGSAERDRAARRAAERDRAAPLSGQNGWHEHR
jgi:hypothetical protein